MIRVPGNISYLVVLILLSLTSKGQDAHYSNNYENLFKLNPSAIGTIKDMSLILTYRNQWPGAGNFVTYDAAFLTNFPRTKSFAGAYVSQDVQGKGAITQTQAAVLYTYKTRIGRRIEISAGLSGSYNLSRININQLSFENPSDVPPLLSTKEQFLDFSSGFQINIYEQTSMGLAASHILNTAGNNKALKITADYHGNYLIWGSRDYQYLSLDPLLLINRQKEYSEIMIGTRFDYTGILGGLYIRQNFHLKPEDLTLLLGTNYKNFQIIYTYDINLSGAASNFSNLAAHEVTFLYKFEYNNKIRRKGAIKCPDI